MHFCCSSLNICSNLTYISLERGMLSFEPSRYSISSTSSKISYLLVPWSSPSGISLSSGCKVLFYMQNSWKNLSLYSSSSIILFCSSRRSGLFDESILSFGLFPSVLFRPWINCAANVALLSSRSKSVSLVLTLVTMGRTELMGLWLI